MKVYWVAGTVLAVVLFTIGFLSPKFSLYILIFSMLLSPEFGARDILGRGFTFRFEDLLLVIMGFAWLAKSAIHKNIGLAVRTTLNRPILYYILACMFATVWGIINGIVSSPLTGFFFVLKYFEYFVVFFLTINNINSKSDLKNLLVVIFITYVIIIINGFIQIPRGVRITAPFEGETGEPNTLGGYLIIMLSLNIALFFNVNRVIHKTALGILGFSCIITILFTLSRVSWIGVFGMYISMIFFIKKRHILVLALIIVGLISPFILPDIVINRVLYTFKRTVKTDRMLTRKAQLLLKEKRIGYDTSTEARLDQMKNVLRDIQKRPLLGYGVTGYHFIDAQYHRVLIETGLIGLIAFINLLWVTGSSINEIRKKYRYDTLYNTLTVGTLAAFIGLLFHCIGTNTFIIVRIMEPFWCLMGLILAIPIIESVQKPSARNTIET